MRWGKAFLAAVLAMTAMTERAQGAWIFGADVGAGIPTGTLDDAWSSGFHGSLSGTYLLNSRFAVGADIGYSRFGTTSDYQALLDFIDPGASNDFTAWRYGVHGRWMVPLRSSRLTPYVLAGAGLYKLKDDYESPTNSDELSQTVFGLQGGLGCDYWMSPKFALGLDASYHDAFTSEDEIGYDSARYFTLAAGVRYKLIPSR